eukprot:m.23154 g.23154  ORF g.23154 m.23154 type:complete len:812 (-) comp11342_c0_seq1:36-2471(-)
MIWSRWMSLGGLILLICSATAAPIKPDVSANDVLAKIRSLETVLEDMRAQLKQTPPSDDDDSMLTSKEEAKESFADDIAQDPVEDPAEMSESRPVGRMGMVPLVGVPVVRISPEAHVRNTNRALIGLLRQPGQSVTTIRRSLADTSLIDRQRANLMIVIISGGSNSANSLSRADRLLRNKVHTLRASNRETILKTWGPDVYFATNEPVSTDNLINLPASLEASGRDGLPKKVKAMWLTVHKQHHASDWYFKVDDDTFVYRSRLEKTLSLLRSDLPIVLGRGVNHGTGFCHGGAGYVYSKGLLEHAAPYMERHCRNMGLSNQWEDLFMHRCLQRVLSVGGVGFSGCTSADFVGFDRVLLNGKNQTANAEVLLSLHKEDPVAFAATVSHHSVHSPIAELLHPLYMDLDADVEFTATADKQLIAEVYTGLRSTSYRCSMSRDAHSQPGVLLPPLTQEMDWRTAICQTPLLHEQIDLTETITTCTSNVHYTMDATSEYLSSGDFVQQRPVVLVYGDEMPLAVSRLRLLYRSTTSAIPGADVIVLAPQGSQLAVDLLQVSQTLPLLSVAVYSESSGMAFKLPAPNRPYCAATAVLKAYQNAFSRVITVPLDSFFQGNPFDRMHDRDGVALVFGPPSNVTTAGGWTNWVANASTGAPLDASRRQNCFQGNQRICTATFEAIVQPQVMQGPINMVVKAMSTVLWSSDRSLYSLGLNQLLQQRLFANRNINTTIYSQYDGSHACLSQACLSSFDIGLWVNSTDMFQLQLRQSLASGGIMQPPSVFNNLKETVSVVFGYSTVASVFSHKKRARAVHPILS